MASEEHTTTPSESVPFGAMERPDGGSPTQGAETGARRKKKRKKRSQRREGGEAAAAADGAGTASEAEGRAGNGDGGGEGSGDGERKDWRKPQRRRGGSRRGGRRRRRRRKGGEVQSGDEARSGGEQRKDDQRRDDEGAAKPAEAAVGEGMFIAEKGGYGTLRRRDAQFLPGRQDIFVAQRLIQKHKLRDGSLVSGHIGRGKKHKHQLLDVLTVDGGTPKERANLSGFKSLTSIDPDFHYEVGNATDDVSMRIVDIIAPIGRGQRGLIVAAPRTGKTTLMRQFAKGVEVAYPDVHLMVLLVDERPEEATEWVRGTAGDVFVSTSDETPKNHVQLAEAVWKRCQRLVELGEDVILILDSITRLARAYNNHTGGSGRTMSGGLDSRAMERPRQIFGSARNTETAGSLTILGTTLVDTGSRMDQLIFEEFKGTGNMELVLSRKLADRRIFPAIDIEKSGTRKEEKLLSSKKHKRITTLRRVLLKMNFMEAMELLITKLEDVEATDDFLQRFEIDPEA
ncbi:MAG: transcription termination factor Rho [Planctomycetota bacterium]|nr:transcription termination factor Rho [Planctomycetota bacterium]MDP6764160.1 transcription termination factor Rho [Planctomycetota bacterium]MDP6989631.1 transcription termination factor Rho [Planctomycetota bacterium]